MHPDPPLAARGERLAAHLLDGILATILIVAFGLGITLAIPGLSGVFAVLAVATWFFYLPLSMQLMAGSTPGKRAFGLWVMRGDGRPAGFVVGLWRDTILKTILSFLIIVDGLFVLVRKDRRALHDLGARTTVRARA